MFFGRILKEHEMKINSIAKRLLVPFVLLVLFLPLIGIDIPTVTRTITVKLFTLPLFVVLSLGGSIIVWYLSRLISKSNWLEYIGKGSLVEYCFNYATLCFIANIYKETIKMGGATHYRKYHLLVNSSNYYFDSSCFLLGVRS